MAFGGNTEYLRTTDGDANEPNPAVSNNSFWGQQFGDAVRNGTIPESRLDDMVCFLARII